MTTPVVEDKQYRLQNAFRRAFLYGVQSEIDYLSELDTSDPDVRSAARSVKMSQVFDKNELAALRNTGAEGVFPQGGASGSLFDVIQAAPEKNLGTWTTNTRENGTFFQAMHRQFPNDLDRYPYADPAKSSYNFSDSYGQEVASQTATAQPTAVPTQETDTSAPPVPSPPTNPATATTDTTAGGDTTKQTSVNNRRFTSAPYLTSSGGSAATQASASSARQVPQIEGLNNPQLESFINAFANFYGPGEAANFFGSLNLDVNAPSFQQLISREDDTTQTAHENTLALQDDAQAHQTEIQDAYNDTNIAVADRNAGNFVPGVGSVADRTLLNNQYTADIQAGDFVPGEGTVADRRLSNDANAANLQAGNFVPEANSVADRRLSNQLAVAELQFNQQAREGASRTEDGRIVFGDDAEVLNSDLDRQNALDIANRQAEAAEYGAASAAGRYGREGITIGDDGRITVDPSQIQESDLNRITQTLVAEIQSGLAQRGGSRDSETGRITQTGAITETDLTRQHEQTLANIQAGLVGQTVGTEAAAERDLRRHIANVGAGYINRLPGSEREADRDLQRDLAGSQATNPFGFAQAQAGQSASHQGRASTQLQRALALQSTGGAASTPGGAERFLDDQARIQSSGGLSDPSQIAHLQTLANINNPYAYQYQADYNAAQAQPGAQAGARSGEYGQVGGNDPLQTARQTFPGGSAPQDAGQSASLEQLRELQLAVNAPQIRQQNIDLLSNPQALGAYVGLGNQLGDPAALQEQISLFNNPNILTDGQQLITRNNLSGFNQLSQPQQGFQFGLAASQGATPDQLYKGLESNTVNSRQNQQTSRFQTV